MSLTTTDRSIVSQVAAKCATDITTKSPVFTQADFVAWHQLINDCILSVLADGSPVPTDEPSGPPAPAQGTAPPPDSTPGESVERGATSDIPACPKCSGPMYDNRANKKNPKGPDFSCRDKNCVNEKGYKTGVWLESGEPS